VAKALKVDPIELFTRLCAAPESHGPGRSALEECDAQDPRSRICRSDESAEMR
jgi:hypothetical protein